MNHPGMKMHRHMLFGTVSREAMVFAHAIRRKVKNQPQDKSDATQASHHLERDSMPYGWPRSDVTKVGSVTGKRYRMGPRGVFYLDEPDPDLDEVGPAIADLQDKTDVSGVAREGEDG